MFCRLGSDDDSRPVDATQKQVHRAAQLLGRVVGLAQACTQQAVQRQHVKRRLHLVAVLRHGLVQRLRAVGRRLCVPRFRVVCGNGRFTPVYSDDHVADLSAICNQMFSFVTFLSNMLLLVSLSSVAFGRVAVR